MTPVEADLIVARAVADQGHRFFSTFLDNLIEEYQNFCPEQDDQDRRSVWMTTMRRELEPGEALALLAIAIDRLAHQES